MRATASTFSLIRTYIIEFLTCSNFVCFTCVIILVFFFFTSRFGVICAFTTNEVLEEGVKDLPKHVRTSMVDADLFINNTKKVNFYLIKLRQYSFISAIFLFPESLRGPQPWNSLEQIEDDSDSCGVFFVFSLKNSLLHTGWCMSSRTNGKPAMVRLQDEITKYNHTYMWVLLTLSQNIINILNRNGLSIFKK